MLLNHLAKFQNNPKIHHMTNFEFLSYEPVLNEKFIGICTIRAWQKIILKYKIVPAKEGNGFFATPASIKNGERYESCFMIDSVYENNTLISMIKEKVKEYLAEPAKPVVAPAKPKTEASVFDDGDCPF